LLLFVCVGCLNDQAHDVRLAPAVFAAKTGSMPGATVIDVRTEDEFLEGHLQHAINYDVNSDKFENQVAGLDKSKPVFVYCRSGHRSHSAVSKMRSIGFKEVYELKGGITEWRAAGLPETKQ